MSVSKQKRKLWSNESMKAAVESVESGTGIREASRLYNVPIETLRRRVTGQVEIGCRPGPTTVLTKEEEDQVERYLIQMADMGFGLTSEAIMHMVYVIVEKCQRHHPFKNNKAGRAWFEGFKARHPNLTVRMPQPLSYCRALCSNKETISDFFGKLGALYGKLNLMAKPMQVYNADETGVTIVHKPGKVIAELGRHNVYSVTSAERGKTHTILSCVSASGFVLPPCMIFPRKRIVPDVLREGAVPNTLFHSSESGWVNKDIYLNWFHFFLKNIPPTRPVLLIQDGHASHISIELIELARANDVHLLCLPAHTTHILQPLDVGVFKSFKTSFSKACTVYLTKYPGRVITSDVISSLVAEAWPNSLTPINIMSGFRKTGIFPMNPGEIDDRDLAPSKALHYHKPKPDVGSDADSTLFTTEQQKLYEQRYQEGYDLTDPEYTAWLRITHPIDTVSEPRSDTSLTSLSPRSNGTSQVLSCSSTSSSSFVLRDVLVLPQPKPKPARKRKAAINSKAVCITELEVLEGMKEEEAAKLEIEALKEEKKVEKERKRLEREEKRKVKELEQKRKREERGKCKNKIDLLKRGEAMPNTALRKGVAEKGRSLEELRDMKIGDEGNSDEDNAVCPKCGLVYQDDGGFWICCDGCNDWYDIKCTKIKSKKRVPEVFFCDNCES